MRIALAFFVCLALSPLGPVWAGNLSPAKLRLADAAAEACLSSCDNQNAACKRVCPTTLGTPCIASCDSQAQVCRQLCQSK
ncbi:hypothetical protein XH86_12795 [Bradyrhizobium guangdongense]|uniref:Four-helix bundle copper-binding protein n=1 Tax=Bradyrhizobium guangdongense TaxID=1325090 RepID=A0ABX6UDW2_9BRAD|nr:hypothetical protein X265_12805 [Bradyrhizobium guangdongense]QOZ59513.1 hypothetical protein XH86_12795 [Bradyrhizobium guangdongense]